MVVGKTPGRFRHRRESDNNCFKNQVDADHRGDGKKWMDAQVRRTFFSWQKRTKIDKSFDRDQNVFGSLF